MVLAELMTSRGVTQTDLAEVLGLKASAINHKIAGRRPWKLEEAKRVLAFLRERLSDDTLTLDQLFGSDGVQLRLSLPYGKTPAPIPPAGGQAA